VGGAALIAVGAVDAGQADVLLDELQAALAVRHLSAINSGPAFQRPAGRPGRPPGLRARPRASRAGRASRADRAIGGRADRVTSGRAGRGTGMRAARLIPIGRMLPFLNEAGRGELYLMSLLVTGTQAVVTAVARYRPFGRGARIFRGHRPSRRSRG